MKPDLSRPVLDPADGLLKQSVVVSRSIPFAKACLLEWHKRDGVDRREWMRRKSFWVPVAVIDAARAALDGERVL